MTIIRTELNNEWTNWQATATIVLEFTETELETLIDGLEIVHGEFLRESVRRKVCAAEAAVLASLFRAARCMD